MDQDINADELRLRMERLRSDLGREVEHTAENVRAMLDWRQHVAAHPWLYVTAGAALGFLLAPRRVTGRKAHSLAAGLIRSKRAGMGLSLPTAGGIGATLAGIALRMAVRGATSQLTRYIENRASKSKNELTCRGAKNIPPEGSAVCPPL